MDFDGHLLQTKNYCSESEDIRNCTPYDHKCPLLEFVKYAQHQASRQAAGRQAAGRQA
jgi:hypothetical protein